MPPAIDLKPRKKVQVFYSLFGINFTAPGALVSHLEKIGWKYKFDIYRNTNCGKIINESTIKYQNKIDHLVNLVYDILLYLEEKNNLKTPLIEVYKKLQEKHESLEELKTSDLTVQGTNFIGNEVSMTFELEFD